MTDEEDAIAGTESSSLGLPATQIEEIARLLREGRRLPSYLIPDLFDVPREYELAYAGKMRNADVLAETMAVPLQAVRTFGITPGVWPNMLVFGDNLQVLRRLLKMKEAGELRSADGTDGVRLCYIDPPFATRREFAGSGDERAYLDRVEGAEFVEALRQRLILIHELLATDGSLYVHLDTRKSHYIKVVLDEVFGEQRFRNEVIWKRTNARGSEDRWPRIHDVLLVYSKGPRFVFEPQTMPADATKTPHTLITGKDGKKYQTYELTAPGQTRDGDSGRPWRGFDPSTFGRHWANSVALRDEWDRQGLIHWPTREGFPRRRSAIPFRKEDRTVPVGDVWTDIDRLNQADRSRIYPTQKPDALLERIIRSSTGLGDLVLDCFAGSGTTAIAAERLRRRWIAIDSGKFAIYATQRRLLRLKPSERSEAGFVLHNAGLYDYEALRSLDWAEYRRFVLDLFQCRDAPHDVSGVVFDGYLGDESALVYDFRTVPQATIGWAFAEDLRRLAGAGLGSRCFLIAPAALVEPYEDYLDIGGTRFFFLRIPYSVIAQIHSRTFSELRQPSSEDLANALVDSVGFDFIQPPKVRCDYLQGANGLEVVIREFESRAYASPSRAAGGINDLAMVMVDIDYSGEVFDVDLVFWADDLRKTDWRLTVGSKRVGSRLMFVYLDVFGNEYREVKPRDAFQRVPAAGRPTSEHKSN